VFKENLNGLSFARGGCAAASGKLPASAAPQAKLVVVSRSRRESPEFMVTFFAKEEIELTCCYLTEVW
jgi:hypothetical protein